ncbi:hybrid sensor histidine kinase/response regulator [Methylobacterium sp. J-070]|uniref:hybrid sensor histidine kinase/response regulator n=1 Tax=Methylobacterium sp. J-070 TaxID=2836650 RepID=UPI001FBAC3C1|nr:hybrid sensor histidine kinase/response regulator [Methylobacterium sp. J-070]MCJ2049466.1 ATP-binding protein [Methylobacterium sp. J-070]
MTGTPIAPTADGTAVRQLRLLAAAALILPLLVFVTASWIAYRNAFTDAAARLQRTLDLVHEHAVKVFETHDLAAAQINQILLGLGDSEILAREADLHARLAALAARLPQVRGIWVLDKDGHALVAATSFPVDRDADLSDRAYFTAQRDGIVPRDQDYIGEVVTGRLVERAAFQISVAREAPIEGYGFEGIVAVSADPVYFRDYYGEVAREGDVTTIALMRDDGALLARYPDLITNYMRRPASGAIMQAIARKPERGIIEASSGAEGVPRLIAYRRLPHHPLYVTAGLDRSEVIRDWAQGMAVHLLFGVPATAGLVLLSLLALRRTQREALALASLRVEMARREETEAQLQQAQKMEAVGRLTGGIAHDFNNLLQIILGSLDLLDRRMTNGDDRHRRLIESARGGATRAASLTQRLLAFSRRQPLDPKPLDANKVVSGLSELLRRTLPETIRIETVLGGGLWRGYADVSQLENALINLAVNARDAMPDGGRLTIETANAHLDDTYAASRDEVAAGQYVQVAVTDTGTGMSREVLAKALEPFFTTKEQGKGTGLGLSMVYGFTKQSGGHVALYSEEGHGTTVKLYLPRYTGVDEIIEARPALLAWVDGKTTILIAEDEEGVRQFAGEALREIGYRVLEADGGAAALRLLAAHPEIALLLTDVVMPEMGGRRVADAALKLRPDLKVVYMTGYTRNAIVHNGALDAGTHLIGKPFTLPQIAAKLEEVLRQGATNPVASSGTDGT